MVWTMLKADPTTPTADPTVERFRAAAAREVAVHAASEEAANAWMVSRGFHNPDGTLTERYADDDGC